MSANLARHIVLAQMRTEPEDNETELVTLAKLIDKDAWRLLKLEAAYTRRLKSLEAAERILSHQDAARSVLVPDEPRALTIMERVRGWFVRPAMETNQ